MSYALGRKVNHDPRSLAFAVGVLPKTAIASVRWTRRVPVFDQGNLGSCTGNAAAGLIGTDSAGRQGVTSITVTPAQAAATRGVFTAGTYAVDEILAVQCYELNTVLDGFPGTCPPDDPGSDGLSAAKTLKALGLVDTYKHAFSLTALDAALQSGPVMLGTTWLESMFNPSSNGRIPVNRTSPVAGGHEYVVDQLDVENGCYWLTNSWGTSWGLDGRGYILRADMQWLLSQQGDVTAPHFLAPQPQPVPVPVPVPVPTPVPAVDPTVLAAYRSLQAWAKTSNVA
jgi:hypothetical protein